MLELLQKRLTDSTKLMQVLYPQWLENLKMYRSIADELRDAKGQEISGQPNLFIPYPWAIVESELPRLAGKLPKIRIFPKNEVDERRVELRQDLLYYAFDRMNFLKTQTLWLRQYAIYGFSPLYYFWRKEMREVLFRPEAGGIGRKQIPIFDDFWCRVVDVFDSFLQPGACDLEEADWFMFREFLSKKDIMQRIKDGLFYPEVKEYVDENRPNGKWKGEEGGRQERDDLLGLLKESSEESYGNYEVMYCLENDRIVAMLDRNIVAASSDNHDPWQEKPIINCNLMPQLGEPLGISTISSLGGLPFKLNALSNARLAAISLALGKVFLADRNAQFDWGNFVMEAGNIILGDRIGEDALRELKFDLNSIESEREVMITKEEMQFVSGVSDYIVGTNTSSRLADTATGISTIVRESNARYALKQATYESGALRKLVQKADMYVNLYMDKEKKIFIAGPDGYRNLVITPADVAWEADAVVEPGSVLPLDQLTRREALINALPHVMKAPNVVDIPKYFKEVFDSMDFRNSEEFIRVPEGIVEDDMKLAQSENVAMGMGQLVELTGNDQMHLQVHLQPVQSKEWQNWFPEAKAALSQHISAHAANVQRRMIAQAQAALPAPAPNGAGPSAGQPVVGGPPQLPARPPQSGGAPPNVPGGGRPPV